MSWAIEEHIGESRPWPAQVVIYRGETSESMGYVSGEVADRLKAENVKLRELVRDMMQAWWACDSEKCPRHDERCEKGKYCAFDECVRELGIEVERKDGGDD